MIAELLRLDEFHPATLIGYIEDQVAQIHNRSNYLGPTILPSKNVDDLKFEYLVGQGAPPVAAYVVDYSSPAPVGRRIGQLDKISGELLTAKIKLPMTPRDMLMISRALASNLDTEVKNAIRRIYDDVETILAGLAARVEWMRWQALSTGRVVYVSEGMSIELDYQLPEDNVYECTVDWSNTTDATPLSDLKAICDAIAEATGVRPARAVCHTSTWNQLLNAKETKEWVHGVLPTGAVPTRPVTDTELRQLLTALNLPAFAIYDVKVQIEDPVTRTLTETYLLPEDTIVLLPPSNVQVGLTLFGPTPTEVLDAEGWGAAFKVAREAPRYVVRPYLDTSTDTPTLWTVGEVVAVPALTGIKYLGILKTKKS